MQLALVWNFMDSPLPGRMGGGILTNGNFLDVLRRARSSDSPQRSANHCCRASTLENLETMVGLPLLCPLTPAAVLLAPAVIGHVSVRRLIYKIIGSAVFRPHRFHSES